MFNIPTNELKTFKRMQRFFKQHNLIFSTRDCEYILYNFCSENSFDEQKLLLLQIVRNQKTLKDKGEALFHIMLTLVNTCEIEKNDEILTIDIKDFQHLKILTDFLCEHGILEQVKSSTKYTTRIWS